MTKARKPSRRARGEGGLYKRASDGLWVGTVDIGYDAAGKRIRRTVTSKAYSIAFDKLADLKRTLEEHGSAPDAKTTVERWLTYWLTDIAAARNKPRTLQGYRTTVTQHLIPYLGRKRLDQLAPQHVRDLHRELAKAGLASSTALKAHRVLAKALTDAQREGRVKRNVATLVDAPSKAGEERIPLTVDQAKTLLMHLAKTEDRLASRWAAALLLGARQGECIGLTWEHTDLDQGVADLSWQLQRLGFRHGCGPAPAIDGDPWPCGVRRAGSCRERELDVPAGFSHTQLEGGLCLTPPKGKPRVVPLPLPMLAFLVQHQAKTKAKSGLVWTRPDGRPIDPSHDNKAWHAALVAAGLPGTIDLHSARHTTASLLLDLDVDPYVIQQILGHANIVTTRGYQHVSLTLARKALDQLGDLLKIDA